GGREGGGVRGAVSEWVPARRLSESELTGLAFPQPLVTSDPDAEGAQSIRVLVAERDAIRRRGFGGEHGAVHWVVALVAPASPGIRVLVVGEVAARTRHRLDAFARRGLGRRWPLRAAVELTPTV